MLKVFVVSGDRMSERIQFNKSGSTIFSVLAIAFAIGVTIYGGKVLLSPEVEAFASSGYWILVFLAMIAVLFVRLFLMSAQVTSIVFSNDIRVYHLMSSAKSIAYKQIQCIRLDGDTHDIDIEIGHNSKVEQTLECSGIPPKQEKLKALLVKHGFKPEFIPEKPEVTLMRRASSKRRKKKA
jgi:hypothetical protein